MTDTEARAALRPLTLREAAEYGLAFMNDPEGLSEVRDLWRGWVRAYLAALPDDGQRETLHVGSIPAAAKRELDALYPKVAETVALSCLGCGQATDRFVTGSLVHDDIGLCARCVDAIRLAALPDDGRGLASPRTAESRETGEGLPEGAMLSVMGPTATPDRRFVALIMDHPSEYTSRTLSVGFGDSMEAACVAARAELGDYDAKTWPYRNKTLDDAVELARLARFRSALPSPPPPDDERLRAALETIRDSDPGTGSWDGWREVRRLRDIAITALASDEPGEIHEEPR